MVFHIWFFISGLKKLREALTMARKRVFLVIIFSLLTLHCLLLAGCGAGGGSLKPPNEIYTTIPGIPTPPGGTTGTISDNGIRWLYSFSQVYKSGKEIKVLKTARTYEEALTNGTPLPKVKIYLWGNYQTWVETDSYGKFSLQNFITKANSKATLAKFAAYDKDGNPLGSFDDILTYFGFGSFGTLQRLEIIPANVTLQVGDYYSFFVYGYDENNYPIWIFSPQWSSSNPSVGTIDRQHYNL